MGQPGGTSVIESILIPRYEEQKNNIRPEIKYGSCNGSSTFSRALNWRQTENYKPEESDRPAGNAGALVAAARGFANGLAVVCLAPACYLPTDSSSPRTLTQLRPFDLKPHSAANWRSLGYIIHLRLRDFQRA
ncbi:hypothetical protein RUM44_001435 [Polyplax serrata]|uniref:Uncharacterized protein n=1 Tax=Polyplax serrata TaxID=468196 RepID=A0ABR1AK12_POLSC